MFLWAHNLQKDTWICSLDTLWSGSWIPQQNLWKEKGIFFISEVWLPSDWRREAGRERLLLGMRWTFDIQEPIWTALGCNRCYGDWWPTNTHIRGKQNWPPSISISAKENAKPTTSFPFKISNVSPLMHGTDYTYFQKSPKIPEKVLQFDSKPHHH